MESTAAVTALPGSGMDINLVSCDSGTNPGGAGGLFLAVMGDGWSVAVAAPPAIPTTPAVPVFQTAPNVLAGTNPGGGGGLFAAGDRVDGAGTELSGTKPAGGGGVGSVGSGASSNELPPMEGRGGDKRSRLLVPMQSFLC